MAPDRNCDVCTAVAANQNTTASRLHTLSHDEHWLIRAIVAKNQNTTEALLLSLAQDCDYYVRKAVLERVSKDAFSDSFFVQLLREGHPEFVEMLIQTVPLSLEVLQAGLSDKNRDIISKALTQKSTRQILSMLSKSDRQSQE